MAEHPRLRIAGRIAPPFRPLNPEEDAQITEEINASGAHIVLDALGCPKQENWMAAHKGRVLAVGWLGFMLLSVKFYVIMWLWVICEICA